MTSRHTRNLSPGSRRLAQPGRSSTGSVIYPPAYDSYAGPRSSIERIIPKYTRESPPRKAQDDYVTRSRRPVIDTDSTASRKPLTVIAPIPPNKLRPVITSGLDAARPSSPLAISHRPRRDDDYYLQPATSSGRGHRRTYTVDSAGASRLIPGGRDPRGRLEHGGYRSSGRDSGRREYHLDRPLVKQREQDERGPGYEYTNQKEQVYRDTAPRPRPRRDSYTGRERPSSMIELEPPPVRRVDREPGPPPTKRGFGNLGRSGSVSINRGFKEKDDPAPSDFSRDDFYERQQARKNVRAEAGAVLHQDEKFYPQREIHDPFDERQHRIRKEKIEEDKTHARPLDPYIDSQVRTAEDRSGKYADERHHRRHGSRDERDFRERGDPYERGKDDRYKRQPEKIYSKEYDGQAEKDRAPRETLREDPREIPPTKDARDRGEDVPRNAALLGAAGVAGLAVEGVRRHRTREPQNGDERVPDALSQSAREVDRDRPVGDRNVGTEASDEERRERRRRRRREREEKAEREDREGRLAPKASEEAVVSNAVREQPSYEQRPKEIRPDAGPEPDRRDHQRRYHPHSAEYDSYSSDSSDSSTYAPRRQSIMRVVTPSQEEPKSPAPAPKGILRPPREKFPEDPAPVREGVAPLKDAGKGGIPATARWTKIDRKMVNPEALEAGNERYEERVDYVIVLRVLTREEINAYAQKTHEIRTKRAKEMGRNPGDVQDDS